MLYGAADYSDVLAEHFGPGFNFNRIISLLDRTRESTITYHIRVCFQESFFWEQQKIDRLSTLTGHLDALKATEFCPFAAILPAHMPFPPTKLLTADTVPLITNSMATILKYCPSITSLNLSYCQFPTGDHSSALKLFFGKAVNLTEFHFQSDDVKTVNEIAEAIKANSRITSVYYLTNNPLCTEALVAAFFGTPIMLSVLRAADDYPARPDQIPKPANSDDLTNEYLGSRARYSAFLAHLAKQDVLRNFLIQLYDKLPQGLYKTLAGNDQAEFIQKVDAFLAKGVTDFYTLKVPEVMVQPRSLTPAFVAQSASQDLVTTLNGEDIELLYDSRDQNRPPALRQG
jgi:hypothetical protein